MYERSTGFSKLPEQVQSQLRNAAETHRYEFFPTVSSAIRIYLTHDASRRFTKQRTITIQPSMLKFRSMENLSFPATDIVNFGPLERDSGGRWEFTVGFMGLSGGLGAMPPHFTALLLDHADSSRKSLRDFLAIFDNRSIGLFYRACESRYRLLDGGSASIRNSVEEFESPNSNVGLIDALVGQSFSSGRPAQEAPSPNQSAATYLQHLRYYSGTFSAIRKSACHLQSILKDILKCEVEIVEAVGEWVPIPQTQRTRLIQQSTSPANNLLGQTFCSGRKTWVIDRRFDLKFGPLSRDEFSRYLPGEDRFLFVSELVRLYVGIEFDFRIQPLPRAGEHPRLRLGRHVKLGQSSWAGTTMTAVTPKPFRVNLSMQDGG